MMKQLFDTFGQALKFLREREGLTQEALADRLGVHRNTIVNKENSDRPPFSREVIVEKLPDILSLSENEVDLLLDLAGYSLEHKHDLLPPYSLENIAAASAGLIEAEHCLPLGKYGWTTGFWKTWALPDFSNGLCINNEARAGVPAPLSKFHLVFDGKAVSVIHRQDVFYGTLLVEIDGRRVGLINQNGPPSNQVESETFRAGVLGRHYLVLHASKETGIVTIDAIRIFGN